MYRMKSMKLLASFVVLLSIMVFIGGCGKDQPSTKSYLIKDYIPFNQNVKMVYEGQGSEFESYTTTVDYINSDKIQIRTNNGGTETVTVLQNTNGALSQIYQANEIYYKEDLTGETSSEAEVLLQEPLQKGTKWSLKDGSQREITGTAVSIQTPYGNFDALEVTTSKDGKTTQKAYYALNTGLVKTISTLDNDELSSSLKEMDLGVGVDFAVRSYNFFVTDTGIESNFADKTVTHKTGEGINPFMATEFLDGKLISPNTVINRIWMKPGSDVANIDFSKEFVTEMNAGTTKETGVLMSVANTVGNYFLVQKVIITIDGKPYSSGHILMKEGEAFDTTYQNAVPD
jgi:hypothetical protein